MTVWFDGANGVRLAGTVFGPEGGTPVLLIGGMGQTRHSWRRAAERVAERGHRAITLDVRGHGESDWAPDGDYSFPATSADLIAVVRALGEPAVLVGASLGGKIALSAAGYGGPTIARGLVIVDTVPRAEPSGVAEVTQVLRPPPEGFASPEAAAAELARIRGRDPQPGEGERMRRNMREDSGGRWHWHWDPAIMVRDHGIGLVPALDYLETASAKLTIPVLLTRGERSPVVGDAGVAAFAALVPQIQVETIAGAAHMLVGDENDLFADALLRFLDATFPR